MATAVVGAAFSVVGKALAPLTDGLLKNWAASVELGDNVEDLEHELETVKILLEEIVGKEIENKSLKDRLQKLQDLAYDADDVLDKLDYFRIQDELDGTFHAADKHPKGVTRNLALNVHHTAKAVGKQIWRPACFSTATTSGAKANRGANRSMANKLTSRSCCNPIHAVGKCFPCSSLPSVPDDDDDDTNNEPPKLRFDRVDASKRMLDIIKKLQRLRQDLTNIIATLGSNWRTVPNIAQSRPITTSESIEPKLFGRDLIMNSIIHDITKGKHSGDALTVIPIVGLGGIGKTTLAQHIYHSGEVQDHFDFKVWTCVSLNFDVNTLLTKIEKDIQEVTSERGTIGELIGQKLKDKRFLLVLDDIWDCRNEDTWKQLLIPFRKSQAQGNIIIVTTRFPEQAQIMTQEIDGSIYLEGIDKTEFKELFLHIVFGDNLPPRHDTSILEIGNKIVDKLKGSPLAAKTVGRLLKTNVDLDHWNRVLESKEWEQGDDKDGIMPALKLSYDYLDSHLQRCFFYCGLFPQDYKFEEEELINFWIGLDVLHSGENKRLEDIGQRHLKQLVNHGFFEKEGKEDGSAYYTIHDLLHELGRKVSLHECLSIKSSEARSLQQIPPSIRHLSVSIDDTSVQDRLTMKNCVEDFRTLDERLKVEKLRSLMLFGKHHHCFLDTFGDLFRQARALRVVVLLTDAHCGVEDLLHNFYNLLHLRYLRIRSWKLQGTSFSRFYHLMVLDTEHSNIDKDLQRNMSNLVKLRNFLVKDDATHSRIVEVGKLKSLQELRRFVVKQDNEGFELTEIGKLVQLCGSLCIDNLENVQVKQEADEAKLFQKIHLHELILRWNSGRSTNDSTLEEHVLERLKPSSNLRRLSIIGNGGTACPSWLGKNLSVKELESLCLDGVAWQTFPPIGELWLVNVPQEDTALNIPDKRFGHLRMLKLVNLPRWKTWALHAPCQLFPFLEVLIIKGCSQLEDLSFSHSACCQQEKDAYVNLFPRLSELKIQNCEQLLSFPPVPWTKASCSTLVARTGSSCLQNLVCEKNYDSEYILTIMGKDTADSMFWNVLAFHNLTKLKEIEMEGCQPMPLHCLQMLSSLRTLTVKCVGNDFPFVEGDIHMEYQFPVESVLIRRCGATGDELTQLLTYFPKLSKLKLVDCEKITGLLLLPPHLQELDIDNSPELRVHLNPLDNNKGEGFQSSSSLRRLTIRDCPKLLTSYSSRSFPFPSSLEYLNFGGKVFLEVPVPLSNLNSLTSIFINRCGDFRGEGLLSLLAQGHLKRLIVLNTFNFFVDSELSQSQLHDQELPSRSSRLQDLYICDVAGFTAMPILLFSSLTTLFLADEKVERFTKEQEALLFVNSLEEIRFMSCKSLQYLPARLRTLPNLKSLNIRGCKAIKMLPEDSLPSSLQELYISDLEIRSLPDDLPTSLRILSICECPEIRSLSDGLPTSLQELIIEDCAEIQSLPKDGLPNSLQRLYIARCPSIRSLPEVDDLPSSLRELTYEQGREELRRQCLKLKQIIPKVQARDMRPPPAVPPFTVT